MMKFPIIFSSLLIVSLNFGCTKSSKLEKSTVAKLGNCEMKAKEFAQNMLFELKSYDSIAIKDTALISRLQEKVVNDFFHLCIVKNWAVENRVSVSQSELNKEIKEIRKNYPDDISFKETLYTSNQSYAEWKERLQDRLLEKKVYLRLTQKITPPSKKELQEYYKKNRSQFIEKEKVKLQQIVVKTEDEALRLSKGLSRSSDWDSLAKKFSIAPEGKLGGYTQWIEKGSLDVFDKAFKMRKGSRSGALKGPFGYHLYKVIDRKRSRRLKFDQVEDTILQNLKEEKQQDYYSKWLEERTKASSAYVNNKLLNSIEINILDD